MISAHVEWCIGNHSGLCTIFFKTNTWCLMFMLYHTVNLKFWDTLGFFFHFYAQPVLGGFNPVKTKNKCLYFSDQH